jgi:ribosome-associated protein YbcJ (S4-like RNA binding protein)
MAKMGGTTWSMTCVPYAQSWAFCYIHSLLEAGLSMSQKRAKKVRLDSLLVERGLVEDLKSARAWIMSGNVIVDEVREDKPGTSIMPDVLARHSFHNRLGHSEAAYSRIKNAYTSVLHVIIILSPGQDLQRPYQTSSAFRLLPPFGKYIAIEVGGNPVDQPLSSLLPELGLTQFPVFLLIR